MNTIFFLFIKYILGNFNADFPGPISLLNIDLKSSFIYYLRSHIFVWIRNLFLRDFDGNFVLIKMWM